MNNNYFINPSIHSPSGGTGENISDRPVVQQVGPYLVTLLLDPDGKFKTILSVAVEKSFLSLEQRLKSNTFHDVESFFNDDAMEKP